MLRAVLVLWIMRLAVAFVLSVSLLGCQTQRQSLTVGGVSLGVAAVSGAILYSARNDDEAPVFLAVPLLAGLAVAVASGVQYVLLDADE